MMHGGMAVAPEGKTDDEAVQEVETLIAEEDASDLPGVPGAIEGERDATSVGWDGAEDSTPGGVSHPPHPPSGDVGRGGGGRRGRKRDAKVGGGGGGEVVEEEEVEDDGTSVPEAGSNAPRPEEPLDTSGHASETGADGGESDDDLTIAEEMEATNKSVVKDVKFDQREHVFDDVPEADIARQETQKRNDSRLQFIRQGAILYTWSQNKSKRTVPYWLVPDALAEDPLMLEKITEAMGLTFPNLILRFSRVLRPLEEWNSGWNFDRNNNGSIDEDELPFPIPQGVPRQKDRIAKYMMSVVQDRVHNILNGVSSACAQAGAWLNVSHNESDEPQFGFFDYMPGMALAAADKDAVLYATYIMEDAKIHAGANDFCNALYYYSGDPKGGEKNGPRTFREDINDEMEWMGLNHDKDDAKDASRHLGVMRQKMMARGIGGKQGVAEVSQQKMKWERIDYLPTKDATHLIVFESKETERVFNRLLSQRTPFGNFLMDGDASAMRLFGDAVKLGTPVFIMRGTGGGANKAALVYDHMKWRKELHEAQARKEKKGPISSISVAPAGCFGLFGGAEEADGVAGKEKGEEGVARGWKSGFGMFGVKEEGGGDDEKDGGEDGKDGDPKDDDKEDDEGDTKEEDEEDQATEYDLSLNIRALRTAVQNLQGELDLERSNGDMVKAAFIKVKLTGMHVVLADCEKFKERAKGMLEQANLNDADMQMILDETTKKLDEIKHVIDLSNHIQEVDDEWNIKETEAHKDPHQEELDEASKLLRVGKGRYQTLEPRDLYEMDVALGKMGNAWEKKIYKKYEKWLKINKAYNQDLDAANAAHQQNSAQSTAPPLGMPKPNTTPGLALGMPKPGAAAPGLAMGTPKPSAAPTPGPGMAKQGNAPGGGNAALGMHKAPPPSPAPSDPKHKRRTVVKAPTDEDPPLGWTMKEVGHEGCEKKESYDGPDAPKEACKTESCPLCRDTKRQRRKTLRKLGRQSKPWEKLKMSMVLEYIRMGQEMNPIADDPDDIDQETGKDMIAELARVIFSNVFYPPVDGAVVVIDILDKDLAIEEIMDQVTGAMSADTIRSEVGEKTAFRRRLLMAWQMVLQLKLNARQHGRWMHILQILIISFTFTAVLFGTLNSMTTDLLLDNDLDPDATMALDPADTLAAEATIVKYGGYEWVDVIDFHKHSANINLAIPLVTSLLLALNARWSPTTKYNTLTQAYTYVESEIFKCRTRTGEYSGNISGAAALAAEAQEAQDKKAGPGAGKSEGKKKASQKGMNPRLVFAKKMEAMWNDLASSEVRQESLKKPSSYDLIALNQKIVCYDHPALYDEGKVLTSNNQSLIKETIMRFSRMIDDDGLRVLSAADYIDTRVIFHRKVFEQKAPQLRRNLTILQVIIFTLTSVCTGLGAFGQAQWIPVTMSLSAAFGAITAYTQVEQRLLRVNAANVSLNRLMTWWYGLSVIEQRIPSHKSFLVGTMESIILTEAGTLRVTSQKEDAGDDGGAGDADAK